MRYGEADRILHLYTPTRGRLSAIAKGVRKARSRFGGRLEPFFRLDLVLYEGRGDLLTVTSAETVAAHPRLREHAGALDGAARACEAVARIFDDGDPHAGVYHLLTNELALLDREPTAPGGPIPSPSASSCCWRPASRRTSPAARAAVSASTWSASPARRAASSAEPARPTRSRSTKRRIASWSPRSGAPGRGARRLAARPRAGGAGDHRDARASRAPATAPGRLARVMRARRAGRKGAGVVRSTPRCRLFVRGGHIGSA